MKTLRNIIQEKLVINKKTKMKEFIKPKNFVELRKIIMDRYMEIREKSTWVDLDLTDIDTSKVVTFYDTYNTDGLFMWMPALRSVDVSGWNTSEVRSMKCLFKFDSKLKEIKGINKWDMRKVTEAGHMFAGCKELKKIGNLTDWNLESIVNTRSMFVDCKSLTIDEVGDIRKAWRLGHGVDTKFMFDDSGIYKK